MLGKLSKHTRERLQKEGRRADAEILEIAHRGMAVTHGSEAIVGNTEVVLKTKLRVEPSAGAAFEVEERFRYGQLSIPPVGARVRVIYDANDHDTIMLDDSGPIITGLGGALNVNGTGTDLSSILSSVREAQAASGSDPEALKRMLQAKFAGDASVIIDQGNAVFPTAPSPAADPVELLDKLAKMRASGVLTEEEFQAQKARLLGEKS